MLYQGHTLKHLKKAVDSLIEICGEDACVGVANLYHGSLFIEDHLLDLVYINAQGEIVGTEGDDYVPKPGEVKAVQIV